MNSNNISAPAPVEQATAFPGIDSTTFNPLLSTPLTQLPRETDLQLFTAQTSAPTARTAAPAPSLIPPSSLPTTTAAPTAFPTATTTTATTTTAPTTTSTPAAVAAPPLPWMPPHVYAAAHAAAAAAAAAATTTPAPVSSEPRPTFVNAKQYRRIIKRREARARLEEYYQKKRAEAGQRNKPYQHESRHRHAMKRPRGAGGRFLTKAELVDYYKKHPEEDPGALRDNNGDNVKRARGDPLDILVG